MNTTLTYNRTVNKLINLFGTVTSRKQIPMAEEYARLLVKRTIERYSPRDDTLSGYWEKQRMGRVLYEVVENNVYRLLEEGAE